MDDAVVVTGVAVQTGLGRSLDACFEAVCAGRTGSREVPRFRDEGLLVTHAAPVEPGLRSFKTRDPRDLPWLSTLIVETVHSSLRAASLPRQLGKTPLFIGTSLGSPAAAERSGGWPDADAGSPETLGAYSPGALIARAAQRLESTGLVEINCNTCAAGNYAIGAALDHLRSGHAPVAVAGGVDELSTLPFIAFSQLRALGRACRPFDVERDGLLFGEGCAFLILELAHEARRREVRALAEVVSVGYSNDAHHLIAPDPTGAGLERALTKCLDDADMSTVDYVNAHGTGTPANDAVEAETLKRVLGSEFFFSSTKGATGHCMGAASAVEAALTVESLKRGVFLPNVGLRALDPHVRGHVVRHPESRPFDTALSVSLGFGGNNAVVAFRKKADRGSQLVTQRPVYLRSASACFGDQVGLAAVRSALRGEAPVSAQAEWDFAARLGRRGLRHVDRGALVFEAAWTADAFPLEYPGERLGVCVGTAVPAYPSVSRFLEYVKQGGVKAVPPMLVPFATANCVSAWWALRHGIRGYHGSLATSDCAGLDAIAMASTQVSLGRIDAALAGSAEGYSDALWRGMSHRYASPLVEASATVWLDSSPTRARAKLLSVHRAFAGPGRLAELPRGSVPVESRWILARATQAAPSTSWQAIASRGEAQSASGVLALLLALSTIQTGEQVVVASDSVEGFSTTLVLEGV